MGRNEILAIDHWAVAHVRSRAEKVLVQRLQSWQVPCFLPLILRRRSYGARQRESYLPLFPGYVFFDHEAISRERLLSTNKVARILPAPDPRELQNDLANLSMVIQEDITLKKCRFGIPGTPVLVTSGPLRGLEGTFVRFGGQNSIVIEVRLIGRAVMVHVDASTCDPVI